MAWTSIIKKLCFALPTLAFSCVCQPAWAKHWFMTGVVENGTRIAGMDRDSIVRQAGGPTRVTLISFSALRDETTTATGDFDVDCAKQRYQQIRVSIVHGDGRRATILSRGPDWDTPTNATDAALMTAACSLDFSGLTDIGTSDPERYVAEKMKGADGHPRP